jgi:hypothetical protein
VIAEREQVEGHKAMVVGRFRTVVVAAVASAVTLSGSVFGAASASYSTTPSFTWVPNSTVFSMARSGDVVYIGGAFTTLRNPATGQRVARAFLAALDANTGELLPWNPGANAKVRALAVGDDGTVYAGGDFTEAGGGPAVRIAALTSDGAARADWSATTNKTVRQIRTEGQDVYIAGNFGTVDGTTRPGVAKLSAADGSLVSAWNARVAGGRVRALAVTADTVLLGGNFAKLGGEPRQFLGSVTKDTGAVTSWIPTSVCDSCELLDLDVDPVTGNVFGATAGGGGGRAVSWSLSSDSRRWIKRGDGDVQSVAFADGVVYVGGHFGPDFDGAVRHQLAALSADNGAVQDWQLAITGNDHPGVWDLMADGAGLYVCGGFHLVGSPTARYGRFPTDIG